MDQSTSSSSTSRQLPSSPPGPTIVLARPQPIVDNCYAPQPFRGFTSNEDAETWLKYFESYAQFKKLDLVGRFEFLGILFRDSAADFYETHAPDLASGYLEERHYDEFKRAFLQRFGPSQATKWKDASDIWSQQQGPTETVDEFVAKMLRMAKRVPLEDEAMLRYAVIRGLHQHIRAHVLQANVTNMTDLLERARVAEVASTPSDPSMAAFLDELRASNLQQQQNAAAIQQLSTRLDKLNVTPLQSSDSRRRSQSRDREHHRDRSSTPTRHVSFDNRDRRRSPSPAAYHRRESSPRRYTYDRRPPTPTRSQYSNNYNTSTNSYYRSGTSREGNRLRETRRCYYCNISGHIQRDCRKRRRELQH